MAGYRDAIDSIRSLAKKAGKKTYTMLMGKPNPAKLANLPEVEVFVMVADPQGMILDSKEYYAPIITPFEAYLAFSGEADWDGSYSLDFTSLQVFASLAAVTCSVIYSQRCISLRPCHSGRPLYSDIPRLIPIFNSPLTDSVRAVAVPVLGAASVTHGC